MAYEIDLSGRVALVTGASGGLGAQFAKTLASAGAGVVLASRRMEKLKDLWAEIEAAGGDAHVVEMDVTDRHSIAAAVAHAETLGYPVVLKIDSPDVIYKSDVGGVELNITNSASVREVFANILERTRQALPNALVHGVSVQSMVRRRHARELMIGVVQCTPPLPPGQRMIIGSRIPPSPRSPFPPFSRLVRPPLSEV